MIPIRLLIIATHPPASYGRALTDAYAQRASQLGHEVRLCRLDQLAFDPILHRGYQVVQPLEPDLRQAQDDILWAQHITLAFPVWWGSVPALLKGFLDRVLLPGFAFRYEAGKKYPRPLLAGRTAHLIVTMDTPPWYFRWIYKAPAVHQMEKTTLAFCGVRPVGTLTLGAVRDAGPARRAQWLEQAGALAHRVGGTGRRHRASRTMDVP